MSKHWSPEADVERVHAARAARSWPEGATAGLLMLAVGCVGFAVLLYRIAGPRDVFGS